LSSLQPFLSILSKDILSPVPPNRLKPQLFTETSVPGDFSQKPHRNHSALMASVSLIHPEQHFDFGLIGDADFLRLIEISPQQDGQTTTSLWNEMLMGMT
jgi:hypothetical protein